MSPTGGYYLGVDVGTGSVRAGIFDADGHCQGIGSAPIALHVSSANHVEQSSDDIWQACGRAVREALAQSRVSGSAIRGLAFDATCSMVAIGGDGRPVAVNADADDSRNVVVWMDHRALEQAERINATQHPVLAYVGGTISPEMQTPKLLWLKEHLPATWARTAHFFDLADFLSWRATGEEVRSLCTTVCKWTYLGHERRWDASYFGRVGLGDLADEGFARIGTCVQPMGTPIGGGLMMAAARELGLQPGTPVGVGAIDAHAGGIGVIGAAENGQTPDAATLLRRLAFIFGTSNCHMAVSETPTMVPGVWGPYSGAMVPGLWLNEAGQSVSGALIDHLIANHARGPALIAAAAESGETVYERLNAVVAELARRVEHRGQLTADLHVFPDFHGNRSPRANPDLRGMISGLTMGRETEDLARLYLAAIQAIAYGTRHIVETLRERGFPIDTLVMCGGGTKNPLLIRECADATGCAVTLPAEGEAMLLGSAILATVAAGDAPSVPAAMARMTRLAHLIVPASGQVRSYHEAKYQVFQRMYSDQQAYRQLMTIG